MIATLKRHAWSLIWSVLGSLIATGLIASYQRFLKANPSTTRAATLAALARVPSWLVLVVTSLLALGFLYVFQTVRARRRNPAPEESHVVPATPDAEAPASPTARLFLGSHYRDSNVHHITTPNQSGKGMVYQSLFVFNDGDRAVRDATLLLWIPLAFDPIENYDWKHPDQRFGAFGFKYVANVPLEHEKRYWHMTYDIPFPIYPNAPPRLLLRFPLWIPVPMTDYILWRIYYDDGVTPPQDAPPGRLGVTTMLKQ